VPWPPVNFLGKACKMNSAVYEGTVRHRRFEPVKNEFKYSLYMMYLDLDELPEVFRGCTFWSVDRFNMAYFRRKDYLGSSEKSLDESVCSLVEERTGRRPQGPIRILTHLRYFGHCYNPVSFYYCYDKKDQNVDTIIAEITNTPWRERHCYVLSPEMNEHSGQWKRYRFAKNFHVSPFIDMNVNYDWRFSKPGKRIQVHMEDFVGDSKIFDATLSLRRKPINKSNLSRVLMRYPLMTVQVLAKIHWQAFRLWRKGAPFYVHPQKRKNPKE
jgi:DUF1365 family protein